jgi:drug/metabolite transporter (DMT)-like permease
MANGDVLVPSRTPDRERWAGTIFAFLSTFLYGASNVAVRYLTDAELVGGDVEHSWILFYKEGIGLAILLPWLLFRWGQGRFQYCSKRLILYVIIAAIICQLIGAQLQVLGYAVIGLIIAVPLIQASALLGVALLGFFVFGDSLSRRRKIAIAILLCAVTILSIGKEMTNTGEARGNSDIGTGIFLLVAVGTVVAGLSYAVYIIMVRYVIRQFWKDESSAWLSFSVYQWAGHDYVKQPGQRLYSPFSVTLLMAIVLAVGVAIFGSLLYGKHGIAGFYTVPSVAWYAILISGICNAAGFLFQVQSLRMTSAVQAALIAVSQMLLLSLIGYLFFHEAVNVVVMIGLGLTAYGIIMSARPENYDKAKKQGR